MAFISSKDMKMRDLNLKQGNYYILRSDVEVSEGKLEANSESGILLQFFDFDCECNTGIFKTVHVPRRVYNETYYIHESDLKKAVFQEVNKQEIKNLFTVVDECEKAESIIYQKKFAFYFATTFLVVMSIALILAAMAWGFHCEVLYFYTAAIIIFFLYVAFNTDYFKGMANDKTAEMKESIYASASKAYTSFCEKNNVQKQV